MEVLPRLGINQLVPDLGALKDAKKEILSFCEKWERQFAELENSYVDKVIYCKAKPTASSVLSRITMCGTLFVKAMGGGYTSIPYECN